MRGLPFVLGIVTACSSKGTQTIDEGCRKSLVGADLLDGSPDVLERVDCYRGYLGLSPLKVVSTVQSAAKAHASWLKVNDILGDAPKVPVVTWGDVVGEPTHSEGFTGVSPFTRNVATGTTTDSDLPNSVWGLFRFEADVDPDLWIQDPYVRDAMFQPDILGVGEATVKLGGVERAYGDVFAAVPTDVRLESPVVYPKDGQQDVPVSWVEQWSLWPDYLTNHHRIGFPITITMACDQERTTPTNPYDLSIGSATLTDGAGGDVPIQAIEPTATFGGRLHTSVVIAARAPLTPDTDYTVDAEIKSLYGVTKVHTTFHTSSTADDTDAPSDTDPVDTDAP